MMRFYHRAFILLAALALTPGATAAPFANGSFEQPGVASGTEETLSDGSTAIAGWTVNKGVLSAYNAASDFAAFGNPNGTWEYGYRTSLAGSFAIFDTPTNRGTSADFWTDSTLGGEPNVAHNGTGGAITPFTGVTLQPGQLAQHPGPNGEYSVIRWNPPHMGTFTVSVDWVGLNAAASTDVYVLLNGSQIYSGTVNGTGTAHYDNASLPNTLPPGIYFEFVVGNGGSSATETDMTGVTITITEAGGDPGMVYVKDDAVPSGPASAFDGAHRVSFGRSGGRGGTLSQTFDTVPGMNYAVNYSITTEGTDDDGQSMSVEAFDGATSLGSTSNNIPFTQGQWSFGNAFGFTATSTSTRLVFSDTTPLGSGANASWALDGVQVHFIVPGSANVWLAGWADGTTAANTDSAPGESPTLAPIAITPGQDITFDVIGGTHNGPIGPGTTDPDGGTDVTHETENSIAELKAPLNSLVGVFLDANQPSGSPAPYVDFTVAENRDYDVLMPGLQQPFFIGNGLTSTSGVQRVRIPAGATRLFLGSLDQFDNAGNFGSFGVIANVVAPLPPITEFSDFQISNGNFGEDWTFSITQSPENAARTLVVQSRIGSGAWVTLPGGGAMTLGAGGVWSLTTADIPLGSGRQFRVLAEADGFAATGFEFAFPFNVLHPAGPILYTRGTPPSATELVIMEVDGSNKVVLTDNTFTPLRCALSPDGKKAAFTTLDGKLYVKRFAGGGSVTPIDILEGSTIALNAFATPAWSPDGHYLAFASSSNLHVIEAVDDNDAIQEFDETTNPVIEVATTFASAPALAWSPDGIYLASTEGSTISAFQIMDELGDITPVDATNTSFPLTLTSDFATQKVSLAWSPDGQQIAFVQETPGTGDTNVALLTVRDATGVVTPEVATTNERTLLGIGGVQTVSWSPDGSLLALESKPNGGTSRIATIRPEAYGPGNPDIELTVPATEGEAFQPVFKQPVGGFQPAPFIAFEAATVSGNEEDAQIIVKVKRTGDTTGTDSVDFIVTADPDPDGNSEEDTDFTITQGPLVFAAGETEKQIVITPIDDDLAEGDGTIEIELLPPDVAELGTIATTTVTMHDGESAGLPFVAQASELKVFINNKAKKKGKGAFDAKWRFEARQGGDNSQPGLRVLIQYSATPEDEQSWQLIPNPQMARSSEGSSVWRLETDDMIPGTGVFFRTITAANVRNPNPGPVVGPFNLTGSGLKLRVLATPIGDPTPTFDKKGVPTYSTFEQDLVLYELIYSNRGPAVNAEVNCSVAEGTKLRVLNFDPDNPQYDATPGVMTVLDRGEISAVKWNVGIPTGESGVQRFRVVVDDGLKPGHSLTGKANLLTTSGTPKVNIKVSLPKVKVVVPFLLEPTATKQNSLIGETRVAGGDTITYDIAYTNETATTQQGVKLSVSLPGSVFLVFKDTSPRDGKDDDFGFEVPGGLEPVFNLGNVPAGASGHMTFKVNVSNGLKPGGTIPGPKFTLTGTTLRKALKGNFVDFTKQSPLYVTASRFGSGLVKPGEVIGYIVRVENQGTTKLTNVEVKFTLPAGVNFEQAGRGGTFDAEFREVTWTLAEIAGTSVEQFGVFTRLKYDYDLGAQVITGGDGSGFKGFSAAAQISGYQASAKDTSGNTLQDTGDAVSVEVSTDTVADRPQIGIFTEAVADGEVDVPFIGRIPGLVPPEVAPNANPPLTGEITVNVRFFNFGNVAARNVRIHGHRFSNTTFVNGSFGLTSLNPDTTLETDERLGTYDLVYGTLDPSEVVMMSYKVKVPAGRRFGFLRQEGATLKSDDLFHTVEDSPEALHVDLVPPVEYEIHVVHDAPRIKEGDVVSYFIDYANKGIIASRAQIEVPLPKGVEYAGGAFLTSPTNRTPRALDTDERLPATAVGTGGPGPDNKWGTRDDDKAPTVVFDLGTLAAEETGMVRLDIRLASPLHPKITPYKTNIFLTATLKGQFGTASGTGAEPERATGSGTQNAPTNTTVDLLPVEKAKPPRLYIGRVAPMSVERAEGKLIAYTIHYGNTATFDPADQQPQLQDAQGVEIAMQIPFGTDFYAAYPGSYVKPNGSNDVKVENPKPRLSGRTVTWPIGVLPRNAGGAVTLVVSLNRHGLDLCAVEDKSCVIRSSNATGRAAGKMATHVRSGNFFASAWESLGCFFKAIGSALTPQVRDQMKDDVKQFNANSMLFTMSGADSISFKNGAFIVPIGQGRIVAGGGGNIVAAGGGNIVAGGGGNIVAAGGGNVLSHNGNAIVAAGGGNIVAAGGGNIVAGGGGNIVAGGGGNITITGLSNGSSLTGAGIISGLIGSDGASLLAIGGNAVGAHGGNLIALDGPSKGRFIGNDGASFSASLAVARSASLIGSSGSTLVNGPGSIASVGLTKPSLDTGAGMTENGRGTIVAGGGGNVVANDGAGVVANDGAGVVANDGAGVVANDGAGIVAGGGGNIGPR